MLKLYNTLTRSLQEFKHLTKGKVGIYSCGPTVYWNQHIGHMYAYVQWDILVRFLRYTGYKVNWVMNITDVGHLTSDEDTGEDKMEKGAKREGLTVWQIADKYINQFLESLDLLSIKRPDTLCRATDHIKEQIELIKKIENNGFAYRTKTGLVFDTSKFSEYAKFAKLKLEKQDAGNRVEVDPEKKNPWDFLLWVTNQPDHIMKWESPWGTGFPGWHIECTAMSVLYLGERFDIHTGGIEHIPIHHTNEIAQGWGAFGCQTANYWLHNSWLLINGEKMSKSLGNNVLVSDLVKKGYSPKDLRYLILNSHYRQGMNFTYKALDGAKNALDSINNLIVKIPYQVRDDIMTEYRSHPELISGSSKNANKYCDQFEVSLENDLNIPQALAVFWETLKSDLDNPEKLRTIMKFDEVLGLGLKDVLFIEDKKEIPEEIIELVQKREALKKEKNYSASDLIRNQIVAKGYYVEDGKSGPEIKKKNRN
jgi:cysteinyl-tRNA synthetase